MENKNDSTLEDNTGCLTAAEPVASYSTRESHRQDTFRANNEEEQLDRIPLGKFGFYTEEHDVFMQRVAEIEADIDEVEAGIDDPKKWIQVDDFWTSMRKEHSWL